MTKKKTYLKGFKCQECSRKIPDLPAQNKGLMAQHFCSIKCQDISTKRHLRSIREQAETERYWKIPPQEY